VNFLRRFALQGEKNLMTARVSILLKSLASLTCFRACFRPGRAKDLSAPPIMKFRRVEESGHGLFLIRCTGTKNWGKPRRICQDIGMLRLRMESSIYVFGCI